MDFPRYRYWINYVCMKRPIIDKEDNHVVVVQTMQDMPREKSIIFEHRQHRFFVYHRRLQKDNQSKQKK